MLAFIIIFWLGLKNTEPRATSVPKAKLGHTEPRAPLVQKAKLGHSNCMRHRVILPLVMAILGFLIIPWLGPKDTELRATSVPKAKLGHSNGVHHRVIFNTVCRTGAVVPPEAVFPLGQLSPGQLSPGQMLPGELSVHPRMS